jgi:hypothetical protein
MMLSILNDDTLATAVARACGDPSHDDRWCPTCKSRKDGIDAYQTKLRNVFAVLRASPTPPAAPEGDPADERKGGR